MRMRDQARACLVALSLFAACEQESADLDETDLGSTLRGGETGTTLRIVTANLAHVSWCEMLARNGFVDKEEDCNDGEFGKDPEDDDVSAQLLGWLQVLYLQTLEGPGPTIFNMQESSIRLERSATVNWPEILYLSLGGNAADPAYADYEACYQRINPLPPGDGVQECESGTPGNAGSWGNAISTNLAVEDYQYWDIDAGCDRVPGKDVKRAVQAIRTEVAGVDLWSVNVHLEFCKEHGNFSVNACNLDNLFAHIDELPEDDVVVVSGDFNISQDETPGDAWCPGDIHPERFLEMQEGFQTRQFMRVGSDRVDHVFLRDPHFRLSGETTDILDARSDDEENYELSDHDFLETDLRVGGPGMSPALVPLYVTLN